MVQVEVAATAAQYERVLAIRHAVFVREQGVAADLEIDGDHGDATYFLATDDEVPLATGRLRVKGTLVKFERIATLAEVRGKGVGAALMARMQTHAAARFPEHLPFMHAQISARGFYERLGWVKVGPAFEEAGIEHVMMLLPPQSAEAAHRLLCWRGGDGPEAALAYLKGRY